MDGLPMMKAKLKEGNRGKTLRSALVADRWGLRRRGRHYFLLPVILVLLKGNEVELRSHFSSLPEVILIVLFAFTLVGMVSSLCFDGFPMLHFASTCLQRSKLILDMFFMYFITGSSFDTNRLFKFQLVPYGFTARRRTKQESLNCT